MPKKLRIKNRFEETLINFSDVSYIEQCRSKIFIHSGEKTYWEYCSMEEILSRLDERMFRCHHSLAVNLDLIYSMRITELDLSVGQTLGMSRNALRLTKRAWEKRLNEKELQEKTSQ